MGSFQLGKVETWVRESSPGGQTMENKLPSSSQRHEVPFLLPPSDNNSPEVTTTSHSSANTDEGTQGLSSQQRFKPKEEMARRFQTTSSSSSSSPQPRVERSLPKQQLQHRAFQETNTLDMNYQNKTFCTTDVLIMADDDDNDGRSEDEDEENDQAAASSSVTQLNHPPEGKATSSTPKKVPPITLRRCDLIPGEWRTDDGRGHDGAIHVEADNQVANSSSPQPQERDASINPTLCEIRCSDCGQKMRVELGQTLIECEGCGDMTILL